MEKLNTVVRERVSKLRLPPGFRFQPTEKEIVFQYLARKIFSHPLPSLIIPEFDVFTSHPSDLPGDGGQDRYFFCKKEGDSIGHCRLINGSGFWKATASKKRIIYSEKMPIIGIRKSFVFYQQRKHGVGNEWAMHEYYLALSDNNQQTQNSQGGLVRIGNWTLCRIFPKQKSSATKLNDVRPYGALLRDSYSSSSSSSSSNSTIFADEVSSN